MVRSIEMMRRDVERRMRRGERFTDVEDVIDASGLSADEKTALWLLAWSYLHPRAQRRLALAHLDRFAGARPPWSRRSPSRLRVAG
jgi:hypothetical protein